MIPILSSIITAKSGAKTTRFESISLSAVYVLGVSTVYAVLGVLSALSGKQIAGFFQQWQFLLFSALLLLFFAATLFNLVSLNSVGGAVISRLINTFSKARKFKWISTFVIGALSALVLSPCITAPMLATIIYIAEQGDVWLGGSSLFLMGLGIGMPLMVFALGLGSLLPKSGSWMEEIKIAIGVGILILAVSLIARFASDQISFILYVVVGAGYLNHLVKQFWNHKKYWVLLFWRTLIISLAIILAKDILTNNTLGTNILGTMGNLDNTNVAQKTGDSSRQIRGQSFAISQSFYQRLNPVESFDQLVKEFSIAQSQEKNALLYFHADWCTNCKTLEKTTFKSVLLTPHLDKIHLIGWDLSQYDGDIQDELTKNGVIGPPILIFYSKQNSPYMPLKTMPKLVGIVSDKEIINKIKNL